MTRLSFDFGPVWVNSGQFGFEWTEPITQPVRFGFCFFGFRFFRFRFGFGCGFFRVTGPSVHLSKEKDKRETEINLNLQQFQKKLREYI